MNNFIKRRDILTVICIIAVLLFFVSGCSIFKKNSGQQPKKEEQSEKIPKQLKEMNTTLEAIFAGLDGPTTEKKEEQGGDKNQEQSQGKDKEQSQDQQQSQDQNTNKSEGSESKQGTESKDPWQQVTEKIKSLHQSWNDYMPEVSKKGASKELLDGLSDSLNTLTETAKTKDKNMTLLAANKLYANIPEIYSLYKTKSSPGLKRITYLTREAVLNARIEDWTKVSSRMDDLKSSWSLLKTTLKEKEDGNIKLDLSIYELDKVVKEKNKEIIEIKGKIVLTNIEELEKSMGE